MLKSIQSKLGLLMFAMLSAVLAVNVFIHIQSRTMMHRIDRIFVSNVSIVELTDALDKVQENVYEYLNTRSSASLENFYRYEQEYKSLCEELNDTAIDSDALMLEKNIRSMSETYLARAEESVQAKRGRNVEEYQSSYQSVKNLYDYINAFFYELNTLRFVRNSANYQVLLRAMSTLEVMSLVLMLAVFIISASLAFMVIRKTIGPLKTLATAADRVAGGDMEVEVPESMSQDEVGVVNNAFREMLDSIRQYILRQRTAMENEARMKETELSMQAHLKEAQLKYLQAQINPHFLFNSLNAGSQLATMEGAERTEEFLARMADFFRYNVRKTEGNATLQEEVETVDNYIYILNVRFAGDINFNKEISPDIDMTAVRMPSMILQPLVENAVQQGIHDDHENGEITLSVEPVEAEDNETGRDCIRITVSDNGVGMTREQLRAVTGRSGLMGLPGSGSPASENGAESREDAGGNSTGIALANVVSRLELYYNESNLFSIWSDGIGCGTEVTVLLPVEEKEKPGAGAVIQASGDPDLPEGKKE